jgi:SAM-dependent methyltransferase
MQSDFETVPCPVCGSIRQSPRYELTDLAYDTPGMFRFVTCDDCGQLYQSPRPTQAAIGRYYPAAYQPFGKAIEDATSNAFVRWLRHRQLRTRCVQVSRLRGAGALLDVGCSTGLFLNEMRRYGQWRLAGIEIDPNAAAYAADRFGLDVFCGPVEAAPWPPRSFDVVTLWDVLEHLPDPRGALRRLGDLLAEGGLLIASVPNLDSVDAGRFGRFWTGLDAPRHFSVFRKRDIVRLMEETGYRVIRTYCFYGRYTTFANSLVLWLRARVRNAALRHGLEAVIRFPLWRYLSLPYFALLDRMERGAILTVVAGRR